MDVINVIDIIEENFFEIKIWICNLKGMLVMYYIEIFKF